MMGYETESQIQLKVQESVCMIYDGRCRVRGLCRVRGHAHDDWNESRDALARDEETKTGTVLQYQCKGKGYLRYVYVDA